MGCPLSLRRRPLSRIHRGEKRRKKREEDGLSALLSLPLTLEGTVGVGSGVVRKFFPEEKGETFFPFSAGKIGQRWICSILLLPLLLLQSMRPIKHTNV